MYGAKSEACTPLANKKERALWLVTMHKLSPILSIYGEEYANKYPSLYLHPWATKHQLNLRNLEHILRGLPRRKPLWLDIACGQAWHFSNFPDTIRKAGLDGSLDQLELARIGNPQAWFVCADMNRNMFPDRTFDLITSFWAAYCYLNSFERIKALVRKVIGWTREGGAIYLEVLLPEDLKTFNLSAYANKTGFRVSPRSPDFTEWCYRDMGGEHNMTSPPLELFIEPLSASFSKVEAAHDSRFMVHVIATGKRAAVPYGP